MSRAYSFTTSAAASTDSHAEAFSPKPRYREKEWKNGGGSALPKTWMTAGIVAFAERTQTQCGVVGQSHTAGRVSGWTGGIEYWPQGFGGKNAVVLLPINVRCLQPVGKTSF